MEEFGQVDRTTGQDHHSLLDHHHHWWIAVPRSLDAWLKNSDESQATVIDIKDIQFPATEIVKKTKEYVQQELPELTYNHSMRVFCWGE
jgi:cyanamide hydratase